MMNKL